MTFLLLFGVCACAHAATLIGPLRYLSRTNSPFFSSILDGKTFLETFERGGLYAPGVASSNGVVVGPSQSTATDSVDSDDGAIDGSGSRGHSFYECTAPAITFTFDTNILGHYPTQAGLVWTDGTPGGAVTFQAFDAQGVLIGTINTNIGDGSYYGTTDEDRFFGVICSNGISAISISRAEPACVEIDHLQYGEFEAPLLSIQCADVDICWYARSNVMYQLQYRSELTTNIWMPIGPPITGTGSTNCVTTSVREDPQRYYRVFVMSP